MSNDNRPENRARLRPSPRSDQYRAQVHDFRNILFSMVNATQLDDSKLMRYFADELEALYAALLKKKSK